MNIVVLLAGGKGKRLGKEIPKQFVEILGKPMIVYAMEIYQKSPLIDAIEVVCVPEYIGYVWQLSEKYKISKLKWVTEGGETCQESTKNGIFNLKGKVNDSDMILINMSTSIFVSEEILCDSLEVAGRYGSAFACMQCIYNNAETDNGVYSNKINFKEKNYTINMPWTSTFDRLSSLYHKAYEEEIEIGEGSYMPTLYMALGEPIYFSKDDSLNKIHITRNEDVEIVTAILEYRERRKEI